MKEEILFSMRSPFRDTFRIHGFRFGGGRQTLAVVGAMRGDEIQQQYVCSQVVRVLCELESKGCIAPGHEILVVPSANPFSMNMEKRFWAMDNTDINRMFPGYGQGETTQRIAAALFQAIQGYEYGVQMASYYIPGDFIPHVRMIRTGYEDVDAARLFGMPYVCLRDPLPFDTTLLNYNWQVWDTKAFSVYGGQNSRIEGEAGRYVIATLLRFMRRIGVSTFEGAMWPDYNSRVIDEEELVAVKAPVAGFFYRLRAVGDKVRQGEELGEILHPYTGEVRRRIVSPADGVVFFAHNKSLALQDAPLFKIHAPEGASPVRARG